MELVEGCFNERHKETYVEAVASEQCVGFHPHQVGEITGEDCRNVQESPAFAVGVHHVVGDAQCECSQCERAFIRVSFDEKWNLPYIHFQFSTEGLKRIEHSEAAFLPAEHFGAYTA